MYYVTESATAEGIGKPNTCATKTVNIYTGVGGCKKRLCVTSHWFSSGLVHKRVWGPNLQNSVFQALGISGLR